MTDESWLECVEKDLRGLGFDAEFIECCMEELRDGETVTVTIDGIPRTFEGLPSGR